MREWSGGFCGRGSFFYDHRPILRQEPQGNPVYTGFVISTTIWTRAKGEELYLEMNEKSP